MDKKEIEKPGLLETKSKQSNALSSYVNPAPDKKNNLEDHEYTSDEKRTNIWDEQEDGGWCLPAPPPPSWPSPSRPDSKETGFTNTETPEDGWIDPKEQVQMDHEELIKKTSKSEMNQLSSQKLLDGRLEKVPPPTTKPVTNLRAKATRASTQGLLDKRLQNAENPQKMFSRSRSPIHFTDSETTKQPNIRNRYAQPHFDKDEKSNQAKSSHGNFT